MIEYKIDIVDNHNVDLFCPENFWNAIPKHILDKSETEMIIVYLWQSDFEKTNLIWKEYIRERSEKENQPYPNIGLVLVNERIWNSFNVSEIK